MTDLQLPCDTRSIAYVNLDNRTCKIIRFLEAKNNTLNLTFYKLSEPTIPLERALTLTTQKDGFLLYRENEDELRQAFKHSLMGKIEEKARKFSLEKLQLEAEKARKDALTKLQLEKEKAKKDALIKRLREAEEREKQDRERKRKDDKLVEQEMLTRAQVAIDRPISMSPEEWDRYKRTGRSYSKRTIWDNPSKPAPAYESFEEKTKKENRVKFKEKLLSHPISGNHFINGTSSNWRKIILKWINEHQRKEDLTVPMNMLLNDMKASGLTFNQKDTNVIYPVKEFLGFYEKELKRDLKTKIKITYLD